jgi:outer membrane protein
MRNISKILLAIALLGTASQADVLRVEVGAGIWNQEPEGHIQYQDSPSFSESDVGYSDENRMYVLVNIKHPVPVLPNIRLEYTPMEFSGTSTIPFNYKNTAFLAGAQSTFNIDQYDAVLYYNILDNTGWSTVDLGLDVKYIDTSFDASDSNSAISEGGSIVLPMAYARVRVEPATGIGFEGDIKYVSYKSSDVYDYRVKVDYTFDLTAVDLGIEVGYRFVNINIDHNDFSSLDTTGDIHVSGFYAGVMARF